jgi:hypothetical protein
VATSSNPCVELTVSKQDLSITFPGGAEMAVQVPTLGFPDPTQVAKQAMAQASAVLAPLVPIFNILDVALALFAAVKAVPDSIKSLNPGKISDVLPDLEKKVGKLLKLVPQLSVPLMILGHIDVILAYLDGLSGQLRAIVDQQNRIQEAANRAAELANVELQVVVDCANRSIEKQIQDLSAGMEPVNRFIALVNIFMELGGLSPLPTLSDLGPDIQRALDSLTDTVNKLKAIRAAIPV